LTATALADGSWLLLGGSDGVAALTSALVFVP
jgi:hypothetical protein